MPYPRIMWFDMDYYFQEKHVVSISNRLYAYKLSRSSFLSFDDLMSLDGFALLQAFYFCLEINKKKYNVNVKIYMCVVHLAIERAFLIPSGDEYVITFTTGLVNKINNLSLFMISTSLMFNYFGQPFVLPLKVTYSREVATNASAVLEKLRSSETMRSISIPLAVATFMLIVAHEFAHVGNGHVRFILDMKDKALRSSIPISDEEIMQVLEFDADESAIQTVYNYFNEIPTRHASVSEYWNELGLSLWAKRPEAIRRFGLLGTFLALKVPDAGASDLLVGRTHPTSLMRSFGARGWYKMIIERNHAADAVEIDTLFLMTMDATFIVKLFNGEYVEDIGSVIKRDFMDVSFSKEWTVARSEDILNQWLYDWRYLRDHLQARKAISGNLAQIKDIPYRPVVPK